jgi:hypothetical protein
VLLGSKVVTSIRTALDINFSTALVNRVADINSYLTFILKLEIKHTDITKGGARINKKAPNWGFFKQKGYFILLY